MREELDLSVVVPTYARAGSVRRLLAALSLQTLAPDRFEVVIALDGSRDGTLELVAGYAAPYRLSSIWLEHRGRAAACNAAVRRAEARILLILDDDMEPAPECLEAHLEAHSGGGRRCVLGAAPIELLPGAAPIASYFQTKFNTHLERLAEPEHHFVARDFYSGNLSLERELLLEVGLFDDSFTLYGNEDVELALRLRAAGAEIVYEPRALARQRFDKDLVRTLRDAWSKGQTSVLVARKHPGALSELRLGTYDQAGPRWRFLRTAFLSVSRHSRIPPRLLTWITLLLERRGVRLPQQYFDLLFDLFFWIGVEQALQDFGANDRTTAGRLPLHR
ncbi:MAG: glycosyltransferase family 2 protein [Gaiellaceae bacterium]